VKPRRIAIGGASGAAGNGGAPMEGTAEEK